MQLTIQNIGRIHEADIRMDGLTVIAGSNNTGKSTLGEALFALTNSQFDFPTQVLMRNITQIATGIQLCVILHPSHGDEEGKYSTANHDVINRISENMASYFVSFEGQVSETDVLEWLKGFPDQINGVTGRYGPESTSYLQRSSQYITEVLCSDEAQARRFRETCVNLFNDSESTLRKLFAQQTIEQLFSGQFESIGSASGESSSVSLGVGDEGSSEAIKASFSDGLCTELNMSLSAQPYVLFIDDPNMLDEVVLPIEDWPRIDGNKSEQFARAVKSKMQSKTTMRSADEQEEYQDKCRRIIARLDSAHHGRIRLKDSRFAIEEDDRRGPILLANVSIGVKAVELLKYIVRKGALDENTFLVLDEPEIHLHPEWQIIYAQTLVEIAKLLGTKVVVTTHSPYFIQAIDVFAEHEWDSRKVHTYTPKDGSSFMVDFFEADDETKSDILDSMAKPFDELQALELRDKIGKSANDD